MILQLRIDECLELVLDGLREKFKDYIIVGADLKNYGLSEFELTKKENKDENKG